MNESVVLDYLISNSNENTFHFDDRTCPLNLIKEVILRGFQVKNVNPDFEFPRNWYGEKLGVGVASGQGFYNRNCWLGEGYGNCWLGDGYGNGSWNTDDWGVNLFYWRYGPYKEVKENKVHHSNIGVHYL